MDEKIFELLEAKDFTELSKNEQDLVLQHMSLEDYTAARFSILNGIHTFDNEIKHTTYDNDLLEELNKKTRKKAGFIYLLSNTKVSLLKIAAIFIFFLLGYTFVLLNILNTKTQNISDKLIKTDTVYITETKIKEKLDTIFITKSEASQSVARKPAASTLVNNAPQKNDNDKVNLKEIYSRVALANLHSSKKHVSRGVSLSHEDEQIIQPSFISDQTCISIDALCNM
jgi:hypothetical protein